jgi:D-lyxose ketol-isomerase
MKRSQINKAFHEASDCFAENGWALPPNAQWDVTDFGLGAFDKQGLVLINLASEVEYCEKLMYAKKGQTTPLHYHKKKKEDIICRSGALVIRLWESTPTEQSSKRIDVKINGAFQSVNEGEEVALQAGERVTLEPLIWHTFYPASAECIIGEVSTANDDVGDNFFADTEIGRYPDIEEDATPAVRLLSEKATA